MENIEKTKYVAVKLVGFDHYIWFETEKTISGVGSFIGNGGWGKGGALTNLKCSDTEILSYIYSEALQYS